MTADLHLVASCSCGNVELRASGIPIVSAVCYCNDCQAGSRQIEELPKAGPVRDPDAGTAYILYRRDRIECTKGREFLKGYKLKEISPANRVVASCCNSAMFMNFDKGPFWVSAYRGRFRGELPPLQMRICTKFKPENAAIADDLPRYPGYPFRLMLRLLASGAAMMFGR